MAERLERVFRKGKMADILPDLFQRPDIERRSISTFSTYTVDDWYQYWMENIIPHYYQYALILETGLRTGELIALTWDCVDFENRTLTVDKTMEYRYGRGCWVAGSPKTISSYRTIPLTHRKWRKIFRKWRKMA